jgi:protein SCO1/2
VNARLQIALVLLAIFALGALVVVATIEDGGDPAFGAEFEGSRLPADLPAPLFSLPNQDGERVRMGSLRGSPVIVTFLYSNCENTCPLQAQTIKGALDELGEDVPALAISVDPANDTQQSARVFLSKQRMTGRMRFVLGSREQLRPIWRGYGVQPQLDDLDHTARIVLVDGQGFQRVGYPLDQVTPERLAHDLRLLSAGR